MEIVAAIIGALLGLACLWGAMRAGRRRRLINDVPTSKTTGVFIGLVELKGTAESEEPLRSQLAETACVQYQWTVAEHWRRVVTETYRDSKGNTRVRTRVESGWKTVAQGDDAIPFYLQDDCGVIRILPQDAEIEPQTMFSQECTRGDPLYYGKGPPGGIMNSTGRRRFTETGLPLHVAIYVLGQARERDDLVAPEIRGDKQAEMYLISTRDERAVSRRFAWAYWGWAVFGLVLSVAGFVVADHIVDPPRDPRLGVYLLAAYGYLSVWLVSWAVMAFNSLVGLRQRVDQAWSNVDVQLKRRAELIPNLVAAVEGIRGHESETQTALAALRSQLGATAPGQPGPDPMAVTPQLVALAESYPELTAGGSFGKLQEQLIETEQRIALARAYFNDIVTFYNTRLQIIPDRFLAAVAGLRPRALMTADAFEREPVQVKLAE